MKTSGVIGQRIVRVNQERVYRGRGYGDFVWNVRSLVLENGTILVPSVAEEEGDYLVAMTAYRKDRRGP